MFVPIKTLLLLLFVSANLSASDRRLADKYSDRIGLLVSGGGQLSSSFVKSGDFPLGTQLGYQSGGSIGYSANKFDFLLNFKFHDAFYSFENCNVLYRKYKGFVAGISFRFREEKASLSYGLFENFGVGLIFEGALDRYYLIEQYMVYPRLGIEFYSGYNLFPAWDFFVINFVIPLTYSFRLSGNYLETGLKIETMFRF